MKFSNKIYAVAIAALLATGCRKLDLAPTDTFSDLTFWGVNENVNNALNNNYSLLYNSDLYFYNEALSDNAYSNTGDYNVIPAGLYTPSLSKFRNDWSYYYSTIKSCNLFLEGVDQNKSLPAATIERMKAEVRFIRAFAHFNLTKWYGDVPLVDRNISPEEAQQIPRSPKDAVVKFIVDELTAVAAILPSKNGYDAGDQGRITNAAAVALQARVLLYQGNRMAEVVTLCEQLMNNPNTYGSYSLAPSYSGLFNDPTLNKTNPETILALQYALPTRTWNQFWDFAPRSVGGRVSSMAPLQSLVDNYIMLNGKSINESGSGYDENNPYANRDPRLTATVVYDGYRWTGNGITKTIYIKPGSDPDRSALDEYSLTGQGTKTGYYWRKYYDPAALANFVSGNNLHLIRFAEVLLMYAEAKQALGQMDAGVWDKTIRALRARAGFTDAAALNYPGNTNMTNIIRQERRTELAMENLRTDDIRRWKIAEVVLNGWARGARFGSPSVDNGYIRVQDRKFDPAKNYLWPIPASELNLNNKLQQNPGY
ncbi:Starch-binding associating with outer membrane [Cnuella takakiae]|uniref:Starch-binding associating with outer membrane n=1 Tax=Cnuella takakiae TaxID=1302690 RepID=A0A1M5CI01_9BACT|nr:RagB/SusD family nutrient uptake outer membrane protein [Cnuella takakiae]OLY91834.1 RagB/SusD family nutrient uptake outer membrane protein [Cnuella takakiae]SHF54394.1 Starch-binding associating with outer membrane [Cnuella takakiae]